MHQDLYLIKRGQNLNLLDTFDHTVIKKRHMGDYWKYLIETCETYFVIVFSNDMETVLWECIYFDIKSATYSYNHYNHTN